MKRRTSRRALTARIAIGVAWLAAAATPAAADTASLLMMPSPGLMCRRAIASAEITNHLPPHLLAAIARVESGRRDPQSGDVNPWPWSINVEGQDHVFDSKPQAIAAVRAFQASGALSIDVGCMQINLMHHPDAFASLEDAFDPQINVAYGASFLIRLFQQTGSWEKATAWYHSATPGVGDSYQRKVAAALPEEQQVPTLAQPAINRMFGNVVQFTPHIDHPRMIPLAGQAVLGQGGMAIGRSLDSYRNLPIALASRR